MSKQKSLQKNDSSIGTAEPQKKITSKVGRWFVLTVILIFACGGLVWYGQQIVDSINASFDQSNQKIEAVSQTLNANGEELASVTAKTRALKAEYSTELAQDLKAVHGLDAETELANILSTEILSEINREVVRTIYGVATKGAIAETTTLIFDLNTDSNGRWMVEKFKGLLYQIEREANAISIATRRGKGNFVITTNDVASALAMAGVLDYAPAMEASVNNDTHINTMVGTVNGMKVYVDPYHGGITEHSTLVGYKGTSPYDAGMFYCPYVPLQMVRAMGEDTFQPKIAFKTRYGMTANPYVQCSWYYCCACEYLLS